MRSASRCRRCTGHSCRFELTSKPSGRRASLSGPLDFDGYCRARQTKPRSGAAPAGIPTLNRTRLTLTSAPARRSSVLPANRDCDLSLDVAGSADVPARIPMRPADLSRPSCASAGRARNPSHRRGLLRAGPGPIPTGRAPVPGSWFRSVPGRWSERRRTRRPSKLRVIDCISLSSVGRGEPAKTRKVSSFRVICNGALAILCIVGYFVIIKYLTLKSRGSEPMRILLINVPHPVHRQPHPRRSSAAARPPRRRRPLLDDGHEVRLIDGEFGPMPTQDIVADAVAFAPDAVLFGHSGSTSGPSGHRRGGRAVAEALPDVAIVYGGVFPTYHWREILAAEPQSPRSSAARARRRRGN